MAQITLEIPDDLAAELEPLLMERDISLGQVVSLYLRSMVNSVMRGKSLKLEDKMPFGKYKGENVGVIARAEPDYFRYLLGSSKTPLKLDPEVLELIK